MIDTKEIVARLQKGESIQDIGNSIAKVLNAANAEYEKQLNESQKKKELASIITELLEWYGDWYDEDVSEYDADILADTFIDTIAAVSELDSVLGSIVPGVEVKSNKSNITKNLNYKDYHNLESLVKKYINEW